ncbi:hypothetical protein ANAPC5_01405 [Anaplasma phagocytophilum]|nr:hypothetical protein ANAPC5_01405 [Anaplasma phagocytophilum]
MVVYQPPLLDVAAERREALHKGVGHRGSMHLTRHSASRIWKCERDTDMNLPECSTHGSQSSLNSRTFKVLLTLLT